MIDTKLDKEIKSLVPVKLKGLKRNDLKAYFENTWQLYEQLFSSIKSDSTYYLSPDPLRNPLIFYWGHTAAFYINKLVLSGLLKEGINPHFEKIFAVGVDPDLPENLDTSEIWPSIQEVNEYRNTVYKTVISVIDSVTLKKGLITDKARLWALMMGLEHDRIHFETSSVLLRQLPVDLVEKPEGWTYAPTFGEAPQNLFIPMDGGTVELGKPDDDELYGWDNEYGYLQVDVSSFAATQNLISNGEYLKFVSSDDYNQQKYWSEEGWEWKNRVQANYPKFWVKKENGFAYRAMFDELDMPLDWPVEVNAHEAWAYCRWKGEGWRLLTEAEFTLIANENKVKDQEPLFTDHYNINMTYGSPCPVGHMKGGQTPSGFNDIFGNVWDWLSDDFNPLPGFVAHPWYEDFSAPFFDEDHSMLLGAAWATTGTGASSYYRLWFRRHFYQHAGFRIARSIK